jgi:hypothetical protein
MNGMNATAADYAWFTERLEGLSDAYCLTLARGLTPAQFLARLNARPDIPRTGIDGLFEPSMDMWDEVLKKGGMEEELLIGVTTVPGDGGDWALAVEVNGYLGVTPGVIVPLSAGTRVVSHYYSSGNRFYWVEDGDIRLYFEPLDPAYREGSTPDALVDAMREAGFDLSEDGENVEHPMEAAMALAERLTGVRITPEILEDSTYLCGIAPIPADETDDD